MPTFPMLLHEPDLRSFKRGETIFKQGDSADCMFALVDGSVEFQLQGTVIERIAPGAVFGEMAPQLTTKHSAGCQTRTCPTMTSVPSSHFVYHRPPSKGSMIDCLTGDSPIP